MWMQWLSQPRNFWGDKIFDFRRITLFCLEKRLSKHKMTIFSKNLGGGVAPLAPWLRLCVDGYTRTPNQRKILRKKQKETTY